MSIYHLLMVLILQQRETDYTQVWVSGIGALVILVPVILNYLQSRRNAQKVDDVAKSLIDEDGRQKIDNVKETVATLATNIDGAMTELKQTIAGKSKAEGVLEGITSEQARTDQTADSTKASDMSQQMDRIEAGVEASGATSLRNEEVTHAIEEHAEGVASRLADANKRADAVKDSAPGAAADAAAQSEKKE